MKDRKSNRKPGESGRDFFPVPGGFRLTDLPKPKWWGFWLKLFKTIDTLFLKVLETFDLHHTQKLILGIPGLATKNFTALSAVVFNGTTEEILGFRPRRLLHRILKGVPDLEFFEKVNLQLALTEHGLRVAQTSTETRGYFQLQLPWQIPQRPPSIAWLRMQPAGIQTLVGQVKVGEYDIVSAPVFFMTNEIKNVVISDIDDTIKDTRIREVVGPKQIIRALFKGNYYEYGAIPGMAELYQSLASKNTIFIYVTSTPYALAPFLLKFLKEGGFPEGPVFMRWLGYGRFGHKWRTVNRILSALDDQRCFLIGDSGELDLQIYRRVLKTSPIGERVEKVLIRHVPGTPRLNLNDPREQYYNDVPELKEHLKGIKADPV